MNVILKKCPFCGGNAGLHQNVKTDTQWHSVLSVSGLGSLGYNSCSSKYTYHIGCNKCKASVGPYSTRQAAEKAWNRRGEING
jgi:hypothetical protein